MARNSTSASSFMHDKLRESIEESLTIATSVLSGLHRVQSYLDVVNKGVVVVEGGMGEVLEQVRKIRSDTASLLQTVYLTEIGLHSVDIDHNMSSRDSAPVPSEPYQQPTAKESSLATNIPQSTPHNQSETASLSTITEQNVSLTIKKCSVCKIKYAAKEPLNEDKCKNCSSNNESSVSHNMPITSSSIDPHSTATVALSQEMTSSATVSHDLESYGEDEEDVEVKRKKLTRHKPDHTTTKQLSCNICKKVFDRPYRLMRHLNIHNPNRPRVSCHICDRSFTRPDTLENHVRSVHTNERPFHCQYDNCQKTFATQTSLVCHLKTHTNGKPYKCQECDASFSLQQEYKTHIRQAHPETEKLRCNDCYQVFPDPTALEQHRSSEHLISCEVCGKKFARLAYLQLHVKVHEGASFFNCSVCTKGFASESTYRQHMKTHSKTHKGKTFLCQLCDISFDVPASLIAHYSCEEHRQKTRSLGISSTTTILNTIDGDLSDMAAIVDDVTMETDTTSIPESSVMLNNNITPTI